MAGKKLDLSAPETREEYGAHAATNKKYLARVINILAEGTRSQRQYAAATLYIAAQAQPVRVMQEREAIMDALSRPEAQTRWECLRSLTCMVPVGLKLNKPDIVLIEDALFDEESGIVREAAFTLLCEYGATGKAASKKVWSLIDEAIQCYHGNAEFPDMLTSLVVLAEGTIAPEISTALHDRMAFDAENGRGTLGMRARQIVEATEG